MTATLLSPAQRRLNLLVAALLLLAILASAFPQPVEAATACRAYHVVKKGETTSSIAQTYKLKWKLIAQANKMDPADPIKVGQRLCIPATTTTTGPKTQPSDEPNARITLNISGGRITLSTSKFAANHGYVLRARNGNTGVGGWVRLGAIAVKKNSSQTFAFNVPPSLRTATIITVCLKDQTTDELVCRNAVNK
jgi:hypothetical protein